MSDVDNTVVSDQGYYIKNVPSINHDNERFYLEGTEIAEKIIQVKLFNFLLSQYQIIISLNGFR
jgi:hypothetical protein